MIMPPMGNRKTSRHHRTLAPTPRFDCRTSTVVQVSLCPGPTLSRRRQRRLTEDDDIENEDDESDDTAAGAILPDILGGLSCDWRCRDERQERQLDEQGKGGVQHG